MSDTTPLLATVQLAAPGLRLRPWETSDIDALYEAAVESLDTVGRWLPWCHPGYVRDDARAWVELCRSSWPGGEHYAFAIVDDEGRLLGDIGLNHFDHPQRRANMGYWIRRTAQGRGIVPRAAKAVAAFGFEALRLQRIEIIAAVDNTASRRCAEKAGAHFEGIGRHRLTIANQPVDAAMYSLLPSDLIQPADAQSSAMS
ncbi:MAG TPA: GNAT family N-acetyltransferase [Dyella sp.]|uniref:GNAT family N-acetyltransferase n=1 Tax=Dyella sp. TaxID=1869338 RepID=UPI002D77CA5B|nr:GNAT family N-acetyltransferase [Dyella sp.]HET6554751.1 GNAT family N-acetyltransferase [Dyella sp.]